MTGGKCVCWGGGGGGVGRKGRGPDGLKWHWPWTPSCDPWREYAVSQRWAATPGWRSLVRGESWNMFSQHATQHTFASDSHCKMLRTIICAMAHDTNQLMMLHHHTKFGSKCSADQKISSRQTCTDTLILRCDLDLESSNQIFFAGHWLRCCTFKPSLVANGPAV